MTFRGYMRWDGWVAIVVGGSLFLFGLVEGHQGPVDAGLSGLVMLIGTAVFMVVRHRAPFRAPGAWFTSKPIAAAAANLPACPRRSLLVWSLGGMAAFGVLTVGLSFLTGFWLTYMDMGVWAIAIGIIKIGPSTAAIAQQEKRSGTTYRVARRPLRGLVELTGD